MWQLPSVVANYPFAGWGLLGLSGSTGCGHIHGDPAVSKSCKHLCVSGQVGGNWAQQRALHFQRTSMSSVAVMRHMIGFFRDVLLWCIMAAQVHVSAVLECTLSVSEPRRRVSA